MRPEAVLPDRALNLPTFSHPCLYLSLPSLPPCPPSLALEAPLREELQPKLSHTRFPLLILPNLSHNRTRNCKHVHITKSHCAGAGGTLMTWTSGSGACLRCGHVCARFRLTWKPGPNGNLPFAAALCNCQ
jgi:hypothetical protein